MVNHKCVVPILAVCLAGGCAEQPPQGATGTPPKAAATTNVKNNAAATAPAVADPQTTAAVQTFCGACHAVPGPTSFPRDDWYHEVQRGYQFYFDSGRTDLVIPVQSKIVEWYQSQAPERLPAADQQADASPVDFERQAWNPRREDSAATATPPFTLPPGVSFVQTTAAPHDSQPAISAAVQAVWFSDMLRGRIVEMDTAGKLLFELRAIAANPVAVRIADFDQDGRDDLVAADLGSPLPADHDRGQVLWISGFRDGSAPQSILEGVGRVADVRPGDFDGDGDLDLVAAEFGWHTTGGLHVIWNEGRSPDGTLSWRPQRLDSRPGGIHVPVLDLDNDGRLDFIALISQEHEVIEAFLNRPNGFEKVRLFAAPDPSWGSSGIEPVDFDSDGDLDLLYTAGDTFDSRLIKPFHGIWLLINQGNLKFEPRHIAAMPGVHRALVGDMDQDGDSDIVACALLPAQSLQNTTVDQLQATIWLEQQPDGSFLRHWIQTGAPRHPAMTLADVNADGRLDVLTAVMNESGDSETASLEVFLNRGRRISGATPPP